MPSEQFIWFCYIVISVLELIAYQVNISSHIRRITGMLLIFMLASVHAVIVVQSPLVFGITFFIIGLYRLLNSFRFVYGRMHQSYLRKSVSSTGKVLILCQVFVVLAYIFVTQLNISEVVFVYWALLLVVVFMLLNMIVRDNIKRATLQNIGSLVDKESKNLPTVTVAIPARNETNDLNECLESVLTSKYQKLEIIVLDDCSHERISDVIKKFAWHGVRFVQGDEPGDTWLPKNAAYQKLLSEATGDLVVFCGVDVRLNSETIDKLVNVMLTQKKQMLSILPQRFTNIKQPFIVQLARYMWELALPRHVLHRPPVLSTLWAIDRKKMISLGGFASVKRMMVPESYFAKACEKTNEYMFLNHNDLGVLSYKTSAQQRNTAIRIRYTQLHKKPENVLLASIALLLVYVSPYMILFYGFLTHNLTINIFIIAVILLQTSLYWQIIYATMSTHNYINLLLAPTLPIVDIALMHTSMYEYEFGQVNWKDRNICLPVMHVTKSLPKID